MACALALGALTSPAAAFELVQDPASWRVAAVGPRERSLELTVTYGGCETDAFHATVTETRTNIGLGLLVADDAPSGPRQACAEEAIIGVLRVPIAHPLVGRRIYALPTRGAAGPLAAPILTIGSSGGPERAGEPTGQERMPRLIGFALPDARNALQRHPQVTLRVHTLLGRGGLPRVVAQTPAPGGRVPPGGTVTLVVGSARR